MWFRTAHKLLVTSVTTAPDLLCDHPVLVPPLTPRPWVLNWELTWRYLGEGNGNTLCVSAWRIPRTEEPGGLPSMGSHGVGQA